MPEHFVPSFEQAMAEHGGEIAAIGSAGFRPHHSRWNGQARAAKVSDVFFVLSGAHANGMVMSIPRSGWTFRRGLAAEVQFRSVTRGLFCTAGSSATTQKGNGDERGDFRNKSSCSSRQI